MKVDSSMHVTVIGDSELIIKGLKRLRKNPQSNLQWRYTKIMGKEKNSN
jgi:hypothetical protein